MKNKYLPVVLMCCFFLLKQGVAATYQVGPGKKYTTISSVPFLFGGDVLEIYPGTYNEFKKFTCTGSPEKLITIKGMGEVKPVIDGAGLDLAGKGKIPKALFHLTGKFMVVENIEFINSDNKATHNSAGIKIERSSNITVRNCKITKCENGIITEKSSEILIENTEVAACGTKDRLGDSHNLDLGGSNVTVKGCYIHDSYGGYNVKGRAHYIELLYNYIADSALAEVAFLESSDSIPLNSNALLLGNVIKKRELPLAKELKPDDTQFIVFGETGQGARNGTLHLINNSLIAGMKSNKFLLLSSTSKSGAGKIVCYNNIFYGAGALNIIYDKYTGANTTGFNNWFPEYALNLPGFKNNLKGTEPGFVNFAGKDYHLTPDSKCVNAGEKAPTYLDGSGGKQVGIPGFEYIKELKTTFRALDDIPDVGAYEFKP